jgi:TPR repeat protein
MRIARLYLLAGLLITAAAACGAPPSAKAPDDQPARADKVVDSKPAAKMPEEKTGEKAPADKAPAEQAAAETDEDGDCKGQSCATRCDKNARPRDCLAAGEALRQGNDGVTASAARAVKYLEKACTLKEREGCYDLGELYASGEEGVPQDEPKAVAMLTSACDLGRGQACDMLSKRAENGEGMKKDHAKAIAFLTKGCAAEDYQVWTCNSLKKAIEGKDRDAVKAVTTWKKACAAKDAHACNGLERVGAK